MTADDVGGGLLLLPGSLQLLFVLPGLSLGLGQLLPGLGQLILQLPGALGDFVRAGGEGGQLRLGLGRLGHLLRLPAAQILQPNGIGIAAVGAAAHFLAQRLHFPVQSPGGFSDLLYASAQGLRLLLEGLRAAAALAHLLLHALDGLRMVPSRGSGYGGGGLMLADGALQVRDPGALFLGGAVALVHKPGAFLRLGIYLIQLRLGLFLVGLRGLKVRLQLQPIGFQLLQIFQPHTYFQGAQLIVKHQVFLSRLRLLSQGLHLQLQLRDLVIDAHQVLLRALELPLRLLLAVAVLADARRLLENLPPVVAADG